MDLMDDLERLIEAYIINAESLTKRELDIIRFEIENNEEVKSLVSFLDSFYSELDRLNRPRKVFLKRNKEFSKTTDGPMLLSGGVKSESRNHLVTTSTFYSEEEKTLLRVLFDKKRKEFQLHILSSYLSEVDILLVEFIWHKKIFVTGRGGKLKGICDNELNYDMINEESVCIYCPVNSLEIENKEQWKFAKNEDAVILKMDGKIFVQSNTHINYYVEYQHDEKYILKADSTNFEIKTTDNYDAKYYFY